MAIVAISCLRLAIRSEISGVVVVEWLASVSMALVSGVACMDVISNFNCSTAVVINV